MKEIIDNIKTMISDKSMMPTLLALLALPVLAIYFFKIRVWGKKKVVTRRRRSRPRILNRTIRYTGRGSRYANRFYGWRRRRALRRYNRKFNR